MRLFPALLSALLALPLTALAQPLPLPLIGAAHSHNDYRQVHPLDLALEGQFASVEVDLWLRNGALMVAHTAPEITPGRTLQSLYLDPLRDRVAANGGWVYAGQDRPLILLIDLKSEGPATYAALSRVLAEYQDMMIWWQDGVAQPGAILPVITGNEPQALIAAERPRRAAIDTAVALPEGLSPTLAPMASEKWRNHFRWDGDGPMPEAELAQLRALIAAAHAQGRVLRFYATPDLRGPARDRLWTRLLDEGVDLINTDDPRGLARFLAARGE